MKIISLSVNLPMHTEIYKVGKGSENGHHTEFEGVVTGIHDMTVDVCDVAYVSAYEIYVDGKLYKRIESTPVSIEYEVTE